MKAIRSPGSLPMDSNASETPSNRRAGRFSARVLLACSPVALTCFLHLVGQHTMQGQADA